MAFEEGSVSMSRTVRGSGGFRLIAPLFPNGYLAGCLPKLDQSFHLKQLFRRICTKLHYQTEGMRTRLQASNQRYTSSKLDTAHSLTHSLNGIDTRDIIYML